MKRLCVTRRRRRYYRGGRLYARARELTQERIGAQRISHELAAEVRGYDEEDDEDGEELGARVDDDFFAPVVHLSDIDREPLAQGGG